MTAGPSARPALVADIGGTNSRIAMVENGKRGEISRWPTADFADCTELVERFRRTTGWQGGVERAAFALAGPVSGPRGHLTNAAFTYSLDTLAACLALPPGRIELMNDLAGVAHAAIAAKAERFVTLHGDAPPPDGSCVVVMPGTGLGVAAIVHVRGETVPLPSEAAHMALAAPMFPGHIFKAEELLALPGLPRIQGLLGGGKRVVHEPAEIAEAAARGDPAAIAACEIYSRLLGGFLADAAHAFAAFGGVVLAGDMPARLGGAFDRRACVEAYAARLRAGSLGDNVALRLLEGRHLVLEGLTARVTGEPVA